jgi:biopolymer transport protein TolQ
LTTAAWWFWQEPVSATSSSLLELILRASPIAKFVLLLLLLFSIASWAIIFAKARATGRARRQTEELLRVMSRSERLSELGAAAATLSESPLSAVYLAAEEERSSQLARSGAINLEAISRAMQSAAISETTRLEGRLGFLASTASASPFIGLFGTVVGIIIAFQGLSAAESASIQAVAPGIAEALVATAAGIAAAIPAVLAYNHYLNRIKLLGAEIDSFSLRLLNFIEREAPHETPRIPLHVQG